MPNEKQLELTILMPCLNEAETLAVCIKKAKQFINTHNISGEVLIADNGSTDGSREIAQNCGARVVEIPERGYGAALIGGCNAAYGKYVIMGDADDSYDFTNLTLFLERLRAGDDLVMGNRFLGGIEKGAMPPLHRYLGNPVLSTIGRIFFPSKIRDFHCGLRGYNTESIRNLHLRTTGMEYASEMVVQAALHKLRISEVPTTLRPDGRSRPPHLRSWSDGWRHLKFLLMYSPNWLFFVPGLLLFIMGLGFSVVLTITPIIIGNVTFDVNTLVFTILLIIVGASIISTGVITKVFAEQSGYIPQNAGSIIGKITAERGTFLGMMLVVIGIIGEIAATISWSRASFGELNTNFLRFTLPPFAFIAIGIQIISTSFLADIIRIRRR
jgi:glycosyltransferase involved in cell wall biosynthesis